MEIKFDRNATRNKDVEDAVKTFLENVETAEETRDVPVFIHQDGVRKSYYIHCILDGKTIAKVVSLDARLNPENGEPFRANRELLLTHNTYLRMKADAENGREFNDIIAEYITSYLPKTPLKIWGGQHRARAISEAFREKKVSRYHGFRIYCCLGKEQRTELALVSNTSISVSNDLFDRQLEETFLGPYLRQWCTKAGLLKAGEDFPDVSSRSDRISTQSARTFIVNYFKGKQIGESLKSDQLDRNVYEPYLCQSGLSLDEEYRQLTEQLGKALWDNKGLLQAGKAFSQLNIAQQEAIKQSKTNYRSFRMKALTSSVLSAWAYVAGLLQAHPDRLEVHLTVPLAPKGAPDPLNADEMSQFRYYQDVETYRGLGTRSIMKDRQRMAQVFLARTIDPEATLDKKLLNQAVNQAAALRFFSKGYTV